VGTSKSGDADLNQSQALGDGAGIETGDDGGCSVLVDDDALMELCSGTSLKLDRKDGKKDGTRVVRLDQGEIRMVVEPRLEEEKIEIHTPAAIATIVGTVLYVSVDALGVTTVTTEKAGSIVRVASSEPDVKGESTLTGTQQLVIKPGEAPSPPRRLDEASVAKLGGCLVNFHALSLDNALQGHRDGKVESVVKEEIATVSLADVAADLGDKGGNAPLVLPPPPDTDCIQCQNDFPENVHQLLTRPDADDPTCGGGLPGKTC
jgi:hypothetical protein